MRKRTWVEALAVLTLAPGGLTAQDGADPGSPAHRAQERRVPTPPTVHYAVTFDAETAAERTLRIEMTFAAADPGEIRLSIPAWTPGSYALDDFARYVRDFEARAGGAEVRWDKADYDTWRVYPSSSGPVTVAFEYLADTMDVGMAWASDDFVFFNGTNVYPFLHGHDLEFPATVSFHTEPGWAVATGLTPGERPGEYVAGSYHELVDMPTFVGAFEADSRRVGGRTYHLATYPRGAMSGVSRQVLWEQIERMVPPMAAVFGEIPWEEYTTLLVFDPDFPGGSALEHANSHLGTYANAFIGTSILASITAHEIFHAWNVKRLRPAELWPYRYDVPQPTELLWVSEGVTDYYADLALVRGGIIPAESFYRLTQGKILTVEGTRPVALEDASLSTWISPEDGTAFVYYPKGSLAGLALDILIRDATDNRASLDDVLGRLYRDTYLEGSGFTEDDWWNAVRTVAPGLEVEPFHDAYVDGRRPFGWDRILPLAGLALAADTVRLPRVGVSTRTDSTGTHVTAVVEGGAASTAGVEVGDRLVRVGEVVVTDGGWGARYRARYGGVEEGTVLEMEVERNGRSVTLPLELRFADNVSRSLVEDPNATGRARRIRDGILTGRVDPPSPRP